MTTDATLRKDQIRTHYDLSTLFYRLLWGPHIHHGLWDGSESPRVAQVNLIRTLAALAVIQSNETVLDVGCGMGGSTIHLARHCGARATGITISPFQGRWARCSALLQGISKRATFQVEDAERVELAASSFDVVWSVECTEHLFDKQAFFRKAATWLRPGGRMAICAWLAGENAGTDEGRKLVDNVCRGFLCPSLGSRGDYWRWMEAAGLEMVVDQDWTERVLKTWEICDQRVRRARLHWLAPWVDRDSVSFLDHFPTILNAYRSRAMEYGCFVARQNGG